ncbi:MAG: tRNA (adenosine(37)-N6)-threonylcarbamoyltransferase complex ATPase subunit type 1 TsaE [Elusimicrobia bacterium]|nr:tRNA (adenosine(37)-N6)-threonylcarbamoyltransferase complex ATPase subunit type 1 TsaE [Elusimicrobiota bacterium]
MFQSKILTGRFVSKNPLQTFNLGVKIAGMLKRGDIICFIGPLGAGKTLFTQGICKRLKVKDFVNSPSFKIINEYSGKIPVYHVDLYRINSFKEIENIGLDEYIYGDGITIIEWAEKLDRRSLPRKRVEIELKIRNKNERYIKWQQYQ